MPTDASRRFRAYVDDRWPLEIDGLDRDAFPHLLRYTARSPFVEGAVQYAWLTPGLETAQIREQIAHFRARRQGFEWKVHALDRPGDLRMRLVDEGFVEGDEETLMTMSLSTTRRRVRRDVPADIVRVIDDAGIAAVIELQQAVWHEDFEWLRSSLRTRLRDAPDTLSIYCAFRDGCVVGSGWTDFLAGSAYPDLHGGSVVAPARGQGIYGALLDARIVEARARGYGHLCVDASTASRRILEHAGFVPVCTTVPMRMRFA